MTRTVASRWVTLAPEEAVRMLDVNIGEGLAPEEVARRRKRYGANILTKVRDGGLLSRVGTQFKSPLVMVLVLGGAVTYFLREYLDTLVIAVVLAVNVAIGAFQEERASKAFERLNASQKRYARVIRAGKKMQVPVQELVRGDVIELHAGAYVPADLRLYSARELTVNESALTGEWMAVSKSVESIARDVPVTEQHNMAWMGTLVVSGYGRGVVVEVGDRTQVGLIARALKDADKRRTPLQESIAELAQFVMYLIGAALVFILLLGLLRGEPFSEILLLAIAVAVAAMPEGLPAAVTVILALGMEAILKRGGLVRNLLAAETLGATTVILTDKTGTLTHAKMELTELATFASLSGDETTRVHDEEALLKTAILASDAFVESREGNEVVIHGRPLEQALLRAGLTRNLSSQELLGAYPRLDYLQFESDRRFGASLHEFGNTERIFITGAPELLIEASTFLYRGGKRVRFSPEYKEQFKNIFAKQSEGGMRLIAAAYKDTEEKTLPAGKSTTLTSHLTFMGLLTFSDPIRLDVGEAIQRVKGAGARVIMVTGDNPNTARTIAQKVGIAGDDPRVYTGADIEGKDDAALYGLLKDAHVFARTLPIQKLRLVRVLKHYGEVVAMTGDGVNDAPALQNASIGIAVGSGTEVAKEASDIILINNSFSIITAAIEEGRRILDNLKKVIAYLLATSSSEIIVIGSALIMGAPLPLLPTQILWANLVQEGLMSFAFAFEPKEADIMHRAPQSHAIRNLLTHELKRLIYIVSAVTGVMLVILYITLLSLSLPIEEVRTIMFVALSLGAIFYAFSLKSLNRPLWKINIISNRFLLLALGASILVLLAAVLFPPLRYLLSLTPLTGSQALLLLGIGLFNLAVIEIVKFMVFRRQGGRIVA